MKSKDSKVKARFFMAKCTIKHTPMPIPSHKTILIGGLNPPEKYDSQLG
jgi:hypothetical protein